MSCTRPRLAPFALVLALACVWTLAFAGLKDKPPEGLKLDGTEWQLDPYNSDDPGEAIDRAARKAAQASSAPRTVGGGVFGGDDPLGRNGRPGDPGDSGFPGDRSRSGSWPTGGGGSPIEIDPTGGGGGVTMQMGRARGSIFFESLRTNPEKLTFSAGNQYVTVSADGIETQCAPGAKGAFSDSFGDGERSCGWSGRAWVIETTRGRQFSRTDRYELSKDGRTLRYTTSATEDGMGRVTIARRYQIPVKPVIK